MGCGSSANRVTPSHSVNNRFLKPKDITTQNGKLTPAQNGHIVQNNNEDMSEDFMKQKVRSPTPIPLDEEKRNTKNRPVSTDGNRHDVIVETHEIPKAVAFEVTLLGTEDNIDKKIPPKRFQKLEPMPSAPKLTAVMLNEKLKAAEFKRHQEIEKVVSASRRSSKRRKELIQAQEFEKEQQLYNEIEEKNRSAGKNRDARQKEIVEKQKRREEQARKARERAKRQQQMGEEDLDIDVEKDETFNADDTNSWCGGDDGRINSGAPKFGHQMSLSASTAQSNNTLESSSDDKRNCNEDDDDFFGS